MSDVGRRIAELSPERRALLELRLMKRAAGGAREPTIPRREPAAPCPLSFAQQRLWFLDRLAPNNPFYNLSMAVRLRGTLRVGALKDALDAIVTRHEALRTTVSSEDGRLAQVIAESGSVDLPVIELGAGTDEAREAEARRLLTAEARRPFDLAHGPLLRTTLLRLGAAEHVLLLTVHHIVFDGWSAGVLWRELGELYQAYVTGGRSPLPELPIQYADFAIWQRRWLQGEILEAQLSYWKRQLADVPVLQLPTDRPRPAVESFRGARLAFTLPTPLSGALGALSERAGVTLFMTLLAAFKALLARYTGQDDIAVGSPIANRTHSELEGLIGFFANSLALRTDLSGDPTFRELLQRVREVALAAYAHQDLPFEKLIEELQPARDLSRNPLFQAMFALQHAPTRAPALPELTASPLAVERGTVKLDLSLEIAERGGSLSCAVRYSTDLFDAATISRMAGHFRTLLEGIVADPDRRLSELPLLTEPERHRLLVEWNDTAADYPRDRCIPDLVAAQVEQTPDAVAVVCGERALTYRELDARANRLAHYLRGLGVGPDVVVGICLERSLELVVGLLGILKAGGAYLPLDPAYPAERLAFMLRDARAPVLVTERRLAERLPEHVARVVCPDGEWAGPGHAPEATPVSGVSAEHLAYVIYTSGSTGRPKGVQIPHRAVVNLLDAMRRRLGLTAEDALLAVTILAFDIAALELFLPLVVGARVILVGRDSAADGARLRERLAGSGATAMQATPATWRLLLEAGWPGGRRPTLLCGGEALGRALADRLLARAGALWNLYGPTETTVWSTAARVEPGRSAVPIGRPLANTRVYLLDRHLQPVPVGVPGELYIGGVGLARGYLNRPEMTAEAFVPDPFRGEPGARLYKTGDLARYRPNGDLEFLGRLDQQVKVRGARVEPGEIEAALKQHPAVREAAVVDREDAPGEQRLVAYLVPEPGPAPTIGDLRGFLRATLPEYMLPAAFVPLEALPLTPNGKLDRRVLPAPNGARPETDLSYVAPRTPLEGELAEIWQDVLGVRPIGVTDDFFELGGHSLLAVRLFARIEAAVGKALPLATLFRGATIEHLADALSRSNPSRSSPSLVAVQPRGARRPFFCVHNLFGDVLCYDKLARHLGPDRPFYALQARGLDGAEPPLARIEAMAAYYVDEIRRVQPEGPYALGGLCASGVVAFEMACQLRARGQAVDLVAVFDGSAPGSGYGNTARGPRSWHSLIRDMPHWLTGALQLTPAQWSDLLRIKLLRARAGLARGGRHRAAESPGDRAARFANEMRDLYELTDRHRRVAEAFLHARRRYTPRVYPGRVTLFRARMQPLLSSHDPAKGWRRLAAGGVEIKVTPGNLLGMLREPHVRVLAEQLRSCLERSELDERAAETALAST